MTQVLVESISPLNLPFTVLLGLVMLYWLLVMLGALDAHIHGDLGGSADVHADLHADADAHVDGHSDGLSLGGIIQFINLGEVPLLGAVSILSLCMWTFSLITNHYFTDHRTGLALAFLIPNLLVSAVATRYLTMPFRPLFRLLRRSESDAPTTLIGRSCHITTSTVSPSFGQAEVPMSGAPLLIEVRTMDGVALPRGSSAVIFREDTERGIYYVVESPEPQLP